MKGNVGAYKFIKEIVDKTISTYDENHERNFIDIYIKEMKKGEKIGEKVSEYLCK